MSPDRGELHLRARMQARMVSQTTKCLVKTKSRSLSSIYDTYLCLATQIVPESSRRLCRAN